MKYIIISMIVISCFMLSGATAMEHLSNLHCGNSRVSILLSKQANSDAGKRNPWVQIHYNAWVGTCMRIVNRELSRGQAAIQMRGLDRLLTALTKSDPDIRHIEMIIKDLEAKARLQNLGRTTEPEVY